MEKSFSTSTDQEKDYILPKTVGGSKVHLLLGVKNTRIQPILLRVLPSGVGVYLSQFKDIWGSRIIFAKPSKSFTFANKELESKTVYAIYSAKEVYQKTDYIGEFRSEPIRKVDISPHSSKSETRTGEVRSEPNSKVEISLHFNKNKVYGGDS